MEPETAVQIINGDDNKTIDECHIDEDKGNIPNEMENEYQFYSDAATYWAKIPATVDGMLGGFGFISHVDIQGSQAFLKHLFKMKRPPERTRALDCGAGIGRITKLLLQQFFDKVDLVEQNNEFLSEAKQYIGNTDKIGELYCSGLQNFEIKESTYDIIWCQWVLGHLTDDDLVKFMQKCVLGLRENGVIVVKENIASTDCDEKDTNDSSVTRSVATWLKILEGSAGLKRIREMVQPRFPKELFVVRMFALRPALTKLNSN